jgi:hypothetical protein
MKRTVSPGVWYNAKMAKRIPWSKRRMKGRAPFRRKAPLYYSFTTNGQTYEPGKHYPSRAESLVYHFIYMGFFDCSKWEEHIMFVRQKAGQSSC